MFDFPTLIRGIRSTLSSQSMIIFSFIVQIFCVVLTLGINNPTIRRQAAATFEQPTKRLIYPLSAVVLLLLQTNTSNSDTDTDKSVFFGRWKSIDVGCDQDNRYGDGSVHIGRDEFYDSDIGDCRKVRMQLIPETSDFNWITLKVTAICGFSDEEGPNGELPQEELHVIWLYKDPQRNEMARCLDVLDNSSCQALRKCD